MVFCPLLWAPRVASRPEGATYSSLISVSVQGAVHDLQCSKGTQVTADIREQVNQPLTCTGKLPKIFTLPCFGWSPIHRFHTALRRLSVGGVNHRLLTESLFVSHFQNYFALFTTSHGCLPLQTLYNIKTLPFYILAPTTLGRGEGRR